MELFHALVSRDKAFGESGSAIGHLPAEGAWSGLLPQPKARARVWDPQVTRAASQKKIPGGPNREIRKDIKNSLLFYKSLYFPCWNEKGKHK